MNKEKAYVTLLTTDNYIYYVIGLYESWKATNSKYKLYCAITKNLSKATLKILDTIGMPYFYIDIEPLQPFILRSQKLGMVNKYQQASNKLALFGLTQFGKCIYLDSDMLILKNIDDLFDKPDFSSVKDCAPIHYRPDEYMLGESAFCAGLFVFSPSEMLYKELLKLIDTLPTNIKWNDQNILAYYLNNWMDKTELHLPCEYELNIAGRENVYNTYIDMGGKDTDIKVKHFVTYKNAPYKTVYYLRDSVFAEYVKYYKFINSAITKYNLKLELVHIENLKQSYNVDLVLPYVDNMDPAWQEQFNKYSGTVASNQQTTAKMRFRSQENFFRYFFRSIERNMPWISNIYLIVSGTTQVPSWLDTTKVRIITHEQIIPREFLPTFNSSVIELFLHKIPGLSEHFIYVNDDFYAWSPMTQNDFFNFTANTCKFNLIHETKDPATGHIWWQMCQNNHDLIYGTNKALPYLRLDHEFRPYLRSAWTECFNLHKKDIYASLSQFRADKNLTCYLYSLYLDKTAKREASTLKLGYLDSYANNTKIMKVLTDKNMLCLNDVSSEINIYENTLIRQQFKAKFSKKSIYELNDCKELAVNSSTLVSNSYANTQASFALSAPKKRNLSVQQKVSKPAIRIETHNAHKSNYYLYF